MRKKARMSVKRKKKTERERERKRERRYTDRINVDRMSEKIAVGEELERFSLKANLHDSLCMIISNELFEVKGKRMEMMLLETDRVLRFVFACI